MLLNYGSHSYEQNASCHVLLNIQTIYKSMTANVRTYKLGQKWHIDIKQGWFWYRFYSGSMMHCKRIIGMLNKDSVTTLHNANVSPLQGKFCLQLDTASSWVVCKINDSIFGRSYCPLFKVDTCDKDRLIKYFAKTSNKLPIVY